LGTLEKLIDPLKNGNNQLINKYANEVAALTGSTAPTTFDATKNIVGKEIAKAIIGSGAGGVEERKELASDLDNAKSPDQLKDVISKWKDLMGGQLVGLQQEWKSGGGSGDFQDKFLTPASKKAFQSHLSGDSDTPTTPAAPIPAGWKVTVH
jgi:hypothetical protein